MSLSQYQLDQLRSTRDNAAQLIRDRKFLRESPEVAMSVIIDLIDALLPDNPASAPINLGDLQE